MVCGDWNIRPDQAQGRERLRQLEAEVTGNDLMRIVSIEGTYLTLEEWEALGAIQVGPPLADLWSLSRISMKDS